MEPLELAKHCDDWLVKNDIPSEVAPMGVKVAIGYFIMIWGVFEYRHLGSSASTHTLDKYFKATKPQELLGDRLEPNYEYFKDRYLDDLTSNFRLQLLVHEDYNSGKALREILPSVDPSTDQILRAIVLICYRLRCNLTHGNKWQHGLGDQYKNFCHAAQSLMKIMDFTKTQ
ncbi:MAG: hypothetical protein ACRBBQ_17715 [Cognatishimia sp.]